VTGVQTCALPISPHSSSTSSATASPPTASASSPSATTTHCSTPGPTPSSTGRSPGRLPCCGFGGPCCGFGGACCGFRGGCCAFGGSCWRFSGSCWVFRGGCCSPGGVPMWLSSRSGCGLGLRGSVVGAVAEHGEEHVAAAAGQADEGGVVFLALGSLAVVVGPAGGVVQGGEGGQEERPFELAVAGAGGVFALDRAAGGAGDGGDPGVGGEVAGALEGGGVADLEQDAGGGPDPDAGHGGQDPGKRVRIEDLLHLVGDCFALVQHGFQAVGEPWEHGVGGRRAGDGHGLLVQRGEDALDQLGAHAGRVRRGDGAQFAASGCADPGGAA